MKLTVHTYSEADTVALGRRIGPVLRAGYVIALRGGLGAGKTHFVQGVAKGMGIDAPVVSPTFSLMNCYDHIPPLQHFDFYRLETEAEIDTLGLEDYWDGGLSLVEWSEKFPGRLPVDAAVITLQKMSGTEREITVEAAPDRWNDLMKEVESYASRH